MVKLFALLVKVSPFAVASPDPLTGPVTVTRPNVAKPVREIGPVMVTRPVEPTGKIESVPRVLPDPSDTASLPRVTPAAIKSWPLPFRGPVTKVPLASVPSATPRDVGVETTTPPPLMVVGPA